MKLTIQVSDFPEMTAAEVIRQKAVLSKAVREHIQDDLTELTDLAKKLGSETGQVKDPDSAFEYAVVPADIPSPNYVLHGVRYPASRSITNMHSLRELRGILEALPAAKAEAKRKLIKAAIG